MYITILAVFILYYLITSKLKKNSDRISHSCRIYRQGENGKKVNTDRSDKFEKGPQTSDGILLDFFLTFRKLQVFLGMYHHAFYT